MRTSITLDDDIHELATLYARGRGVTLGTAIGELVRKGEATLHQEGIPTGLKRAPNGLLIFAAQKGRVLTSEMVKKYQEDELG